MALMNPEILGNTLSSAERRLFNRFQKELPDSYIVIHSLGLTRHDKKLFGECDFVVIAQRGVFIIEVKGGGVQSHNGIWFFTNKYGQTVEKREGPFQQASGGMFAVKNEILNRNHIYSNVTFGYGVIMPDEVFLESGPEIEQQILLDKRSWLEPLGSYIKRLENYWEQETIKRHALIKNFNLDRRAREEICLMLRPNSRTAYTISSRFNNVESELIELTEEQGRVLPYIEANLHNIVTGGAGTGKTILATEFALTNLKLGKQVAFLCYNRILGEHLAENFFKINSNNGSITVSSIHSWFMKVIREAGAEDILKSHSEKVDNSDFYNNIFPELFMDCFVKLDMEEYDCLVIDEAQDLISPSYLDAFDLILKGGLKKGQWAFFLDPLQDIYDGLHKSIYEYLEKFGVSKFPLTKNCRNSRKVAIQASVISGVDVPVFGSPEGGEVKYVFYSDKAHLLREINNCLEKWIKEGISVSDIIILSPVSLDKSDIAGVSKIGNHYLYDLTKDKSRKIGVPFCTMQAFKGLERKCILVVDMPSNKDNLLYYCGLTRARVGMIIFWRGSEKEYYDSISRDISNRLDSIISKLE